MPDATYRSEPVYRAMKGAAALVEMQKLVDMMAAQLLEANDARVVAERKLAAVDPMMAAPTLRSALDALPDGSAIGMARTRADGTAQWLSISAGFGGAEGQQAAWRCDESGKPGVWTALGERAAPDALPVPNVLALISSYAGAIQNGGFCPSSEERAEIASLEARVVAQVTALGQQAARSEAPAGWKLVPIEPTDAMKAAPAADRPGFSWCVAREVYASMLAASPPSAQPAEKL